MTDLRCTEQVWQSQYKRMMDDGFLPEEVDVGQRTLSGKIHGNGDGVISCAEIAEKTFHHVDKYFKFIKEISGKFPAWVFNDYKVETKYDDEIKLNVKDAINAIRLELDHYGIPKDSDDYFMRFANSLVAFAYYPKKEFLDVWEKKAETLRLLKIVNNQGMPAYADYLSRTGGLGIVTWDYLEIEDGIEVGSAQAVNDGVGKCSEISRMLYGLLKTAGFEKRLSFFTMWFEAKGGFQGHVETAIKIKGKPYVFDKKNGFLELIRDGKTEITLREAHQLMLMNNQMRTPDVIRKAERMLPSPITCSRYSVYNAEGVCGTIPATSYPENSLERVMLLMKECSPENSKVPSYCMDELQKIDMWGAKILLITRLIKANRKQEAEDLLNDIMSKSANGGSGKYGLGILLSLFSLGKYNEANKVVNEQLEASPASLDLLRFQAGINGHLGLTDNVFDSAKKMMIFTDTDKYLSNNGIQQDAISHFQNLALIINSYLDNDDDMAAAVYFKRLIVSAPKQIMHANTIAMLASRLGKFSGQLALEVRERRLREDHAIWKTYEACFLLRSGQKEKACQLMLEVINDDNFEFPEDSMVFWNVIDSMQLGYDQIAKSFECRAGRNNDSKWSIAAAYCYYKNGDVEKARSIMASLGIRNMVAINHDLFFNRVVRPLAKHSECAVYIINSIRSTSNENMRYIWKGILYADSGDMDIAKSNIEIVIQKTIRYINGKASYPQLVQIENALWNLSEDLRELCANDVVKLYREMLILYKKYNLNADISRIDLKIEKLTGKGGDDE